MFADIFKLNVLVFHSVVLIMEQENMRLTIHEHGIFLCLKALFDSLLHVSWILLYKCYTFFQKSFLLYLKG